MPLLMEWFFLFFFAKTFGTLYNSITMTIKNLLRKYNNILEAEIILAHVLKKETSYLKAHNDISISWWHQAIFLWFIRKRIQGLPLAYLTKEKYFFGLPFFVNKHTLIPRPETELIVEDVLRSDKESMYVFDIGTGSGCIPIAISKHNPKAKVHASDVSSKALKVAQKNNRLQSTTVSFFRGSLAKPILPLLQQYALTNTPIIITANLPYLIPSHLKEPTIKYEPVLALVSDNHDGLHLYRELCSQLAQTGIQKNLTLYCEINPEQNAPLQEVVRHHFPQATITVLTDLQGLDRIVKITI